MTNLIYKVRLNAELWHVSETRTKIQCESCKRIIVDRGVACVVGEVSTHTLFDALQSLLGDMHLL
jgi:hypothetical protein